MIEIVEHDQRWATTFESLRTRYVAALVGVPVVAIEHVGSTAVSGLAAKPVIDIDIVVERSAVGAAIAAMEADGFRSRGDLGIPDRWALAEPAGLPRTNTYVVVDGSLQHRNHVGLRDVLRRDVALRDEYGAVKRALAAVVVDIDDYIIGKSDVIGRILAVAGLGAAERDHLAKLNRAAARRSGRDAG